MSPEPYFTIVIPTYNRAAFIAQTIQSVLSQSFSNFEVIVVDDGSTDLTAEIVSTINDPRLSYHPKENEERAVARNTGAALAKGKYINFFDSDDLLYENHLAVALETIERHDQPEFFHLAYDIKDPQDRLIKKVNEFKGELNAQLIHGNVLSCNGVFLRKDIALKYPFNPDRQLSASEDYELWMRLASRYTLYYNNTITSTVVNHEMRSVLTVNKEKLLKRISLFEKYLFADAAFRQKFKAAIPIIRADNCTYIALHLALTKKYRWEVVKYLFRALGIHWGVLKKRRFYATLKHLI